MQQGTGAATAAAQDVIAKFDNALFQWYDGRIKDAGNVTLEIDGDVRRVVGLTPNGFLKAERLGGGDYESVPLTQALIEELMPKLAHFKGKE